jgi:tetratricopeptide (TPR) repeat protein
MRCSIGGSHCDLAYSFIWHRMRHECVCGRFGDLVIAMSVIDCQSMQRVLAIELVALGMTLGSVHAALGDDSRRVTPPVAPPSSSAAPLVWDDLPGPQLEVVQHPPRSGTPAIPPFTLPATEPGLRSPRELRVRGRLLLGTEVKVRGFVTWAYNCPEALAIANPRATRAQIETAVHNDPALCERPTFSLGDAPDTSRDASITVVSPDPPARGSPAFAAGDYVVVTGRWSVPAAPSGASSDGVLVWSTVERAGPNPLTVAEPVAELQEMEMDLDGPPVLPVRKVVDDQTINTSIEHMNACNQAIVARRYDAAISECQAATDIWEGNHLAWYARAGAHLARREWRQAKAAAERAVTLRPDQAMYQLYYGIALYEAAHEAPRGAPAHTAAPAPRLEAARTALLAADKRAPELWRAHYYLGRVYRELDDARRAAVQFSATIRTNPGYLPAYIALIEIYRRWDYIDQALAVAMLGAASLPVAETADLWFEVGIIHDARHADDQAIEAFSKAIAASPNDAGARFERAQLYLRKGDLPSARRDLEEVARSTDRRAGVTKQLAAQLLAALAARRADDPQTRLPSWECSHDGVSKLVECRRR